MARPRKLVHVGHPILRLDVVEGDGRLSSRERVFCRYRRESVPVEECVTCSHCDAITSGPDAAVECTIPETPASLVPDPAGIRTPVGELLSGPIVVVEGSTTLRDALRSLYDAGRRSLAVVDRERVLVGVLHEVRRSLDGEAFAMQRLVDDSASEVRWAMSSVLAVHEATSVRAALRLLATSHLREVTVVASDGTPLGLFRDIDGLRWVGRAHRTLSESDDDLDP